MPGLEGKPSRGVGPVARRRHRIERQGAFEKLSVAVPFRQLSESPADGAGVSRGNRFGVFEKDGGRAFVLTGGVILLGNNVKSATQVKSLTRLFGGSGAAMTPLIAVDQEGGEVQRLGPKAGYRAVPRAATVAEVMPDPAARQAQPRHRRLRRRRGPGGP